MKSFVIIGLLVANFLICFFFTKKYFYVSFIVCDNNTFMSWYSVRNCKIETWKKEKLHKNDMKRKMLFV